MGQPLGPTMGWAEGFFGQNQRNFNVCLWGKKQQNLFKQQWAMLQEHPQGVSRKVYGHRKQGDWGCENGLGAFYFY